MSLSKQQKEDLNQLGDYFKKLEKMSVENNIDLDVFISEYKDNGYAVYATEQVAIKEKTKERQKIFKGEKSSEKKKDHASRH